MKTPAAAGGNVVILALDTMGDIILRQPLFCGLLDSGRVVTVLVRRGYEGILPLLDDRLKYATVDLDPYRYSLPGWRAAFEESSRIISEAGADTIILAPFQRSMVDEMVLRSFGALLRIGLDGFCFSYSRAMEAELGVASGEAFDVKVSCDERAPEVEKNRRLLDACIGEEVGAYRPRIMLKPEALKAADAVLSERGIGRAPFIACCPAGTVNVGIKGWPPERYAEAIARIQKVHGIEALIFGAHGERHLIEDVARMASARGARASVWTGGPDDIGLLAGILKSSRMYLGNDTGPMHLSAALGVPVAAIFGGGHWPRFLPTADAGVVLTQELPCFYCRWVGCYFDDAPCVKYVGVDEVTAAVERLLDGRVKGTEVRTGATIDGVPRALLEKAMSGVSQHVAERVANVPSVIFLENALKEMEGVADERLRLLNERGGDIVALRGRLAALEAGEAGMEDAKALRSHGGFGWLLELNARGGARKNAIPVGPGEPGLISVITPVYNAERYIEECVRSVWAQEPSGRKVEIIAVDDGSRDGSLKLLNDMAAASPVAMRVLRHPDGANRGVSATRNLGLSHSRGEWVSMLDADDAWEPGKLRRQVEYLSSHPEARIICSYGFNIDDDGKPCTGWTGGVIAGDYSGVPPPHDFKGPLYTFDQLLRGCPVVNSTVMVGRRCFAETGGYSENMSQQTEDWLMWAELSVRHPMHLIEEPLIRYRIHHGSWTTRYCAEDLGDTVRFEFFMELLYWMFTNSDASVREMGYRVYKRHFPVFLRPVARFMREVDAAIAHDGASGGMLERLSSMGSSFRVAREQVKALEERLEAIRRIPGYRLVVKMARGLGLLN
jgi:glycosyltransferase involved in cell wall biosynthesis/ADP-heptose:LPS heptosyltransferase